VQDPAHLPLLLDAFETTPLLEYVQITFHRGFAAAVEALKRGLRRLAASPALLRLSLDMSATVRKPWHPIGDAERRIVGCLYTVRSVRLTARSLPNVRLTVQWLAMLPALTRLEITILDKRCINYPAEIYGADAEEFIQEVRAALPWVTNIELA
jgi:hypothetical protein